MADKQRQVSDGIVLFDAIYLGFMTGRCWMNDGIISLDAFFFN